MDRDESEAAAERDRLIAAAWSILERTDFAGLKVQRVATQAGVSTARLLSPLRRQGPAAARADA